LTDAAGFKNFSYIFFNDWKKSVIKNLFQVDFLISVLIEGIFPFLDFLYLKSVKHTLFSVISRGLEDLF